MANRNPRSATAQKTKPEGPQKQPKPPFPEQQEIVRRVQGLFALADQIEARFEKARAQVERLTPSLLARAFRGELVPQDPDDEPATALFTRIQPAATSRACSNPRVGSRSTKR